MTAHYERYSDEQVPEFGSASLEMLFDPSESAHNLRWRDIPARESPIVRYAIVSAQAMRDKHEDPGDAYLQGLAVGLAANRQEAETEEPEHIAARPHLRLVLSDPESNSA